MTSTGIPHAAAVVAAPIRKLCPAYFSGFFTASVRAFQSSETNWTRVRGCQLDKNKGPSPFPRTTKYASSAATGIEANQSCSERSTPLDEMDPSLTV